LKPWTVAQKLSESHPYPIARPLINDGVPSRGRPTAPVEDEPSLREYWSIIRADLTLIVTVVACALLASGIAVLAITPKYTASSVILIEPQDPQVLDIKQLMAETAGEDHDFYKTQYALLRSWSLAAQVIHGLDSQSNSLLSGLSQPHGSTSHLRSIFAVSTGGSLPKTYDATPGAGPQYSGVQLRLVNAYLAALSVEPEIGTRLVMISFTTPDAGLSAALANAHAEGYLRRGLELKAEASRTAQRFLGDKLVELKQRVEKSEAALNHYRHDKGIVEFTTARGNAIPLKRLADLSSALSQAETNRIALESEANLIKQQDYYSLPEVVSSPMVQALKPQLAALDAQYASMSSRYTPEYAPLAALKAKLDETRARLNENVTETVRSVRLAYFAAVTKEKELSAEVAREKASDLALNDASLQDSILAREVDTNRQLYQSVLQRMREMEVQGEVRASNVSLVDRAVPPLFPSSPRKFPVIFLSGVLALVGAVGIVLFLDYLDDTFKTFDEIERQLRLPSLASVPDMRPLQNRARAARSDALDRSVRRPSELIAKATGGDVKRRLIEASSQEAYRTLRSQLLLSRAGDAPRTLLITSAVPGEGKTITAVNTAITFARRGRSVLLIDADLRRGRCHELLDCAGQQGLSEVLTGQAEFSDAIMATSVHNLSLLRAGGIPPDPPELLGSAKMEELLTTLVTNYQYVIIDSCPVIAISDSLVLSQLVDGVIIVTGRTTPKHVVKRACQRVSDTGAKILGVVLNQLDPRLTGHYSYGGYFYYHEQRSSSNGVDVTDSEVTILFG
jgi:polysaccharide biosynthesis transport protein